MYLDRTTLWACVGIIRAHSWNGRFVSNMFIVAVHYTHINTCFVLLLLLLYTTHISTHAMFVAIVAVHYTHQYMLCIVAVHYTHINTCYVLLLYTTHTSIHAMYCCYCCCTLRTSIHAMYYCYCCCTLRTSIHAMHCCYC